MKFGFNLGKWCLRRGFLNIVNGRQRQRRRTPEHGYTIMDPFEPNGSGGLKQMHTNTYKYQIPV